MSDPERHHPLIDHDRRVRLNQRLRQAFIDGAEVDMRRRLGREPTAEEWERVLRQYPGDLPERREQKARRSRPCDPVPAISLGRAVL